ncbi:hypothetical protein CYMTET_35757 [Cymbomonas tetramitiformis]|uniref:Leucine-rich repeat-containing N-terminal plant-type domain-containing protein n=1 Tax=Cymbomonas tetramitiformis TaxID=36881 RepID=A0AAE0KNU9_9CHLO|nr:hypothetical protein CYMTET_35757 [Cymbomonas tetramitiformis]
MRPPPPPPCPILTKSITLAPPLHPNSPTLASLHHLSTLTSLPSLPPPPLRPSSSLPSSISTQLLPLSTPSPPPPNPPPYPPDAPYPPAGTACQVTTQATYLLAFKAGATSSSAVLEDWTGDNPCLGWTGVSCTDVTGTCVEHLRLSGLALTGTISRDLGGLTHLSTLQLHSNSLRGAPPPELGELRELTDLQLQSNLLTSSIPVEYAGRLVSLSNWQMGDNSGLSGTIPSLAALRALTSLGLRNNALTGSVPNSILDVLTLTSLDLSGNQLSGEVPALADLVSLNTMDLSDNQLTGTFPGIGAALVSMEVDSNRFEGAILESLGGTALTSIAADNNPDLCGTLPPSLSGKVSASGTKVGATCQPCVNQGYPTDDYSATTEYSCSTASSLTANVTSLAVVAGSAQGYRVWLSAPPASPVTVTLTCSSGIVCSPTELIFEASSGCCQSMAVTVASSGGVGGTASATIEHTVATADLAYASASIGQISVGLSNAYLILSVTTLTATEGDSVSYSVALNTAPTSDVTVSLEASCGASCLTFDQSSLVFTPASWSIPQTVVATSVSDGLVVGNRIASIIHSVASAMPEYNSGASWGQTTSVTIVDTDSADFVFSPSAVSAQEGSSVSITVALSTAPSRVSVTFSCRTAARSIERFAMKGAIRGCFLAARSIKRFAMKGAIRGCFLAARSIERFAMKGAIAVARSPLKPAPA